LKLHVQPPELAAIPWEYLYHPGRAEYVSLSTQTPIVRYLDVPHRIQPLTVMPPLRILGMIASPLGLPSLDIGREKQRIENAITDLRAQGLVDLTWLPGQTWRDLLRAMRQGPWHIFHFIGHGGFDVHTGEGLVVLADREGRPDRFSATRLGRLLADHASLRLVLLNSCEGARGSEHDIFSSAAASLVRRGILAVLAMQYEITDRAAIEFARTFYEALGDGMAVDGAVAEARKAISFALTNTVEWGTPVLYMRSPDGVLFHVTGAPRAEAPAAAPPVDAGLERRLEQRYTAGLGAFWLEEWDEACGHFQAIVDERPEYQDAADKLAEAWRQKKWGELYEQAQAAREAEDWEAACSALGELVAERPDYKDAAALLEAMNRQVRLAGLYAQAQRLHQAGQWQAVANVFVQIAALDPDFADPEELLPAAKQELAEEGRRAELDDRYSRAVREMDAGRWPEARRLLRQVQEQEPGYLEAERLLARAESEIERERQQQAEGERREQVAGLYAEAQELTDAGQWQPAQDKLAQIRDLDPQFADPEGVAARARRALDREEEEAQRRRELAALYDEAVGLLRAERFEEALDKWAEVQAIDPAYPDRNKVQATARKKLAARDRPALWRRLPRGVWVAMGAVALIAVLVAGGAALWPIITGTPAPTPTGTVEPTDTSAATLITTSTLAPTPMGGPPLPGLAPTNPVTGTVWEWSDGSAMVYVPAGEFPMGSTAAEQAAAIAVCVSDGYSEEDCRTWFSDEDPQCTVYLDAFWIDRTEVTNGEYQRCVEDGACDPLSETKSYSRDIYYGASEFDDYPVIYVDWEQANAYCAWAGKRLPTEAEWEKAARGTDKRIYPWGEGIDCDHANYGNCVGDTARVASRAQGASPYGALNMAGNVQEWVADWYNEDNDAHSRNRNPQGPDSGERRVQRGGSWYDTQGGLRAADRSDDDPSFSSDTVGFRCARSDFEPPEPVETATPTRTPPPTSMPTPTPGPPVPNPMPVSPSASTVWEWSDGSAMVYVPAGAFWMGTSDEDIDAILVECSDCQRGWYANEQPQREVTLDALWIDRTEVTNAQYRRCVDDGVCSPPSSSASGTRDSYYDASEFDDYPVIYVDWAQANAYCTWAGKRLPTEAEWEKAARGTDQRLYPWGNAFNGGLVNFCDVNCTFDSKAENWDDSYLDTSPVGYYPGNASPYSALDMAGNVWEWVADWYSEDYYAGSPVYNPQGPDSGPWRVKRGGAWGDDLRGVRSAIRHSFDPTDSDSSIGFRCARSDSEPSQSIETATPTPTPGPPVPDPMPASPSAGNVWEWSDGSAMVYVPAGAFWMGSDESDPEADEDEKPQREVSLDAFWIDRTEVTNGQYRRCVEDGACDPPSETKSYSRDIYYGSSEFDNYPVIYVDWEQANTYCAWAGKRLPTEAEWEKAARGTDRHTYPWGGDFDGTVLNSCDVNCGYGHKATKWDDGYADTAPVGNYPQGASPYGALDMAGNVWEWVGDWYGEDYYASSPDRNPQGPDSGVWRGRVLRGGSWAELLDWTRAANRGFGEPSLWRNELGFRCARSGSES
jgi:formylglycine-generating enzyme required for sulfatase activity